jgi:hypothetical protein
MPILLMIASISKKYSDIAANDNKNILMGHFFVAAAILGRE